MVQYVYTINRVGKVVPPKREIPKDICFFSGAKIGILGKWCGKSTLLKIMAGLIKIITVKHVRCLILKWVIYHKNRNWMKTKMLEVT